MWLPVGWFEGTQVVIRSTLGPKTPRRWHPTIEKGKVDAKAVKRPGATPRGRGDHWVLLTVWGWSWLPWLLGNGFNSNKHLVQQHRPGSLAIIRTIITGYSPTTSISITSHPQLTGLLSLQSVPSAISHLYSPSATATAISLLTLLSLSLMLL